MKDYIDKLVTPLQSLLQNTNYRFNNPLGGAFLFSWLIFNWESVFYFFFSDESTAKKIEYLKGIYQILDDANGALITNYNSLLWFPLIASILYLFIPSSFDFKSIDWYMELSKYDPRKSKNKVCK